MCSDGTRRYHELNADLLLRVPQLRDSYLEIVKLWDDEEPGPHIVFGDALLPYLIHLLSTEDRGAALPGIFEYLEQMASDPEQSVRDVLGASVLEGLNEDATIRRKARAYMGPATKKMAEAID